MSVMEEWEKLPRWCTLGAAADFLEVGIPVARRLAEDGALDPSFRTAGKRGHWRISKDGIASCIGLRVLTDDAQAIVRGQASEEEPRGGAPGWIGEG